MSGHPIDREGRRGDLPRGTQVREVVVAVGHDRPNDQVGHDEQLRGTPGSEHAQTLVTASARRSRRPVRSGQVRRSSRGSRPAARTAPSFSAGRACRRRRPAGRRGEQLAACRAARPAAPRASRRRPGVRRQRESGRPASTPSPLQGASTRMRVERPARRTRGRRPRRPRHVGAEAAQRACAAASARAGCISTAVTCAPVAASTRGLARRARRTGRARACPARRRRDCATGIGGPRLRHDQRRSVEAREPATSNGPLDTQSARRLVARGTGRRPPPAQRLHLALAGAQRVRPQRDGGRAVGGRAERARALGPVGVEPELARSSRAASGGARPAPASSSRQRRVPGRPARRRSAAARRSRGPSRAAPTCAPDELDASRRPPPWPGCPSAKRIWNVPSRRTCASGRSSRCHGARRASVLERGVERAPALHGAEREVRWRARGRGRRARPASASPANARSA